MKVTLDHLVLKEQLDGRAVLTVLVQHEGITREVVLSLAPHVFQDVLMKFRQMDRQTPDPQQVEGSVRRGTRTDLVRLGETARRRQR